jgi:hypothetical protein
MIFDKTVIEHGIFFWISMQHLSETFLFLETAEWDNKKCTKVFMKSITYSSQIFMDF